MGINEIEIENNIKHTNAFDKEISDLPLGGIYSWKKKVRSTHLIQRQFHSST